MEILEFDTGGSRAWAAWRRDKGNCIEADGLEISTAPKKSSKALLGRRSAHGYAEPESSASRQLSIIIPASNGGPPISDGSFCIPL
jgi:hypothetical protein